MKRDFSDSAYNELIRLIGEVESEKWCDFTDWIGDGWYGFQEWIGVLNIDHYINDVNSYHKKVIDKNNTSKETIDAIFADVKNIDKNYMTRFAAYKTRLEQFISLVDQFSTVVSPSNGTFDPGNLPTFISQFEETDKYLKMIGGDGLTEDDVNQMDSFTQAVIVSGISSTFIDLLPNVAIGEEVEIPIGPEITIYYSVTGSTETESPIDLNYIAEDQRLKLKNISFSADTDGALSFGVEGNTDGEVSVMVEAKRDHFSINRNGDMEGRKSIGTDTYTIKFTASLEEVTFEESVTTEVDKASVTSAFGIKKSDKKGWTPIPVPVEVPVPVPVELPKFEVPDINWKHVAVGAGIVVVVGAAVFLAPYTGGGSLVLLGV